MMHCGPLLLSPTLLSFPHLNGLALLLIGLKAARWRLETTLLPWPSWGLLPRPRLILMVSPRKRLPILQPQLPTTHQPKSTSPLSLKASHTQGKLRHTCSERAGAVESCMPLCLGKIDQTWACCTHGDWGWETLAGMASPTMPGPRSWAPCLFSSSSSPGRAASPVQYGSPFS